MVESQIPYSRELATKTVKFSDLPRIIEMSKGCKEKNLKYPRLLRRYMERVVYTASCFFVLYGRTVRISKRIGLIIRCARQNIFPYRISQVSYAAHFLQKLIVAHIFWQQSATVMHGPLPPTGCKNRLQCLFPLGGGHGTRAAIINDHSRPQGNIASD